jgi:hypothetical protein
MEEKELTPNKANEAEASGCAHQCVNGTGCRAAALPKMRTGFEKCASWKIPTIPSKMRTLFQDAHLKLRIFAECS